MKIKIFNTDGKQFFGSQQLFLTRVGKVEVSTVLLPRYEGDPEKYETCLFHDDGTSDVVRSYRGYTDAQYGHMQTMNVLAFAKDRGI